MTPVRTAARTAALRRDDHLLVSGGGRTRSALSLDVVVAGPDGPSRYRASVAGRPIDAPSIKNDGVSTDMTAQDCDSDWAALIDIPQIRALLARHNTCDHVYEIPPSYLPVAGIFAYVRGRRLADSLTSSRGRAPQPSRSIRIHHNARCEPRRCAAASLFSYRRPDCAAASRSSIRALFRPTRSKRLQACRAATAGQRRWPSGTCRGLTRSSAARSRSRAMGGAVARVKATATWNSPSCASSVTRRCVSPRPWTIYRSSTPCPAIPPNQPLSVIATPTPVIRIKRPSAAPTGIDWTRLTAEDLEEMPILAELKRMTTSNA
jgi:hypothetical protein